jgi:hypothetical protein
VLPPPENPGLVFDPAGEVSFRVMLLGEEAPGRGNAAAYSLVSVRAFRVRLAAR